MSKITVKETFEILSCATCAVRFALHESHIQRRRNDNKSFYCPNQHSNVYPKKAKPEIEKLKEKVKELEATIQKLIAEKNSLQTEKSELQAANGNLEQIVDVMQKRVTASTADCQ